MTSSGVEPAIFRLVAQCLNQLRYREPQLVIYGGINAAIMAVSLSFHICKDVGYKYSFVLAPRIEMLEQLTTSNTLIY
jgi:hypothetical protein